MVLLQQERLAFQPDGPSVFGSESYYLEKQELPPLSGPLERRFPKLLSVQPSLIRTSAEKASPKRKLTVGVVLSGGPAAGGHNVISGLFARLKSLNKDNQLFGFIGGPKGIIDCKFTEITKEKLAKYQNQGGFDIITTGRNKIETPQEFADSLDACKSLSLDGLVVVGGDDSNTNAALLAEYFYDHGICVVGCPKTIDGDLKNQQVQCSFGFDTATKVYSELIGNIMADAKSSAKYYHFIRLMGRSASHIALECALATRPNITIIGEEIAAKKKTLSQITDMICDIIVARSKKGINFGVVVVPEGLIEFIPEIAHLIDELNTILAQGVDPARVREKCSQTSRTLFDFLPKRIQHQLVLERDPHGNVQVSKIQTERLLIDLVEIELAKRKKTHGFNGKFNAMNHFFGYEGRCALPSNFDCNYCYALGKTAAILLENRSTGVMATVGNLHLPTEQWAPGGYPLVRMMNMERRKGKIVPVIRKALVEIGDAPFQEYKRRRIEWATNNHYVNVGPIQFYGPTANQTTITLALESGHKYEEVCSENPPKLPSKL